MVTIAYISYNLCNFVFHTVVNFVSGGVDKFTSSLKLTFNVFLLINAIVSNQVENSSNDELKL